MTVTNRDQKRLLEQAAVDWLLKCEGYQHYSVARFGEMPDVLLRSNLGELLGLEITHIYYNDQEAKLKLGRATYNYSGIQCSDHFIVKVNEEIAKKVKKLKNYPKEYPVSLLIRSASDSASLEYYQYEKERFIIPDNAFKNILVLFQVDISGPRVWTDLLTLQ